MLDMLASKALHALQLILPHDLIIHALWVGVAPNEIEVTLMLFTVMLAREQGGCRLLLNNISIVLLTSMASMTCHEDDSACPLAYHNASIMICIV